MFVSRLTFHTQPGKTADVEQELQKLMAMVSKVGGERPRVLRNHFASLGAPDIVFEQEAPDLEMLETQIKRVTATPDFQRWTQQMSGLLAQSPKREIYLVVESR
jgi:quinol monooxygenase YgiN